MAEQAEQLVLSTEEPVLVSNRTQHLECGHFLDLFKMILVSQRIVISLLVSCVKVLYLQNMAIQLIYYHHLKLKHPKKYLEIIPTYASEAGRSQTINNAFLKTQKMSTSSREHHELTRAITVCLAKDMLPLYLVDKPGFRKMLEKFNSRYQIPQNDHFSRIAIPGLYNEPFLSKNL